MRLFRRLFASFLAAMLLLALFAAAAPARGKLHHRHAHGPRAARLGSAVALKPGRALRGASPKPVTRPAPPHSRRRPPPPAPPRRPSPRPPARPPPSSPSTATTSPTSR